MASTFEIETRSMTDFTEADRVAWLSLLASDTALESPYHHPDYHHLVDKHQGGGKVTLARRDGELIGLLPWQGGAFARPSGAPLSDYQTLIAAPNTELDIRQLLMGQAVGAFHYTAVPTDDGLETTRLELNNADEWRAARDGSYRRHLKSTRRRIRKAEDEVGTPRTVMQSRDIDAYQTLMQWKQEKFRDTGKYDVLANSGNSALLRELWERGPSSPLRADLHVLYFGDRLAACDLGLTDGHVFHSWIVGYDPDLITYAPGIQLMEALIDAAPNIGYGVIDLGPGTDGYKRHYATHSRQVASGVVTLPSTAGWIANCYDQAEDALRSKTGDALGKLRRRYSQIAACEPRISGRSLALVNAFGAQFKRHEA